MGLYVVRSFTLKFGLDWMPTKPAGHGETMNQELCYQTKNNLLK